MEKELPPLTSADQVWKLDDTKTEQVPVPEWGMMVTVKAITAKERDAYEAGIFSEGLQRSTNVRAALVARSIVNGKNKRIFSDQDIIRLGDKSAAALDRVFDVAKRLAGLSRRDVEELEKNSEGDPSDGLPSD